MASSHFPPPCLNLSRIPYVTFFSGNEVWETEVIKTRHGNIKWVLGIVYAWLLIFSHRSNIHGLICPLLRSTSAQSSGKHFSFLFGKSWIEIRNLALLADAFW
jgi:hypothetical protein